MKIMLSLVLTFLLMSCQSQDQVKESSNAETTDINPAIEILKENTMMLYRQDPSFVYYENNASETQSGNISGLYKIHQVCEAFAERIKNNDKIDDSKKELIKLVERKKTGIISMKQKTQKKSIYLTYENILKQLNEMDFNSENTDQSLLNLTIVENMLVQNITHDKNFTPYKFNSYEPIVFAASNSVKLNDSIPLNIAVLAFDSTEAVHVQYTTNPKDLDNNNNITEVRGRQVYLKGKKKGNHILYGRLKVETRAGEEIWLPWQYSYTVN